MRSIISTVSPECLGERVAAMGVGAPSSGTWPALLDAIFVPFSLVTEFVIRAAFVANGGAVNGSWDIGVYDAFVQRVFSTGAILQGGVSAVQIENVSPHLLRPGDYYLMMSNSSGTSQVLRSTLATASAAQVIGLGRFSTAFVLPLRLSLGPFTTTYLPHFGLMGDRRVW